MNLTYTNIPAFWESRSESYGGCLELKDSWHRILDTCQWLLPWFFQLEPAIAIWIPFTSTVAVRHANCIWWLHTFTVHFGVVAQFKLQTKKSKMADFLATTFWVKWHSSYWQVGTWYSWTELRILSYPNSHPAKYLNLYLAAIDSERFKLSCRILLSFYRV